MSINGLPFNSEGYEQAKKILKSRYRKISEIVNAYVQAILALPHPWMPTSEDLRFLREAVNKMSGRLQEITGYVRMTLDKLEGIRGDLVQNLG